MQPMVGTIVADKMRNIPVLAMAENWIKNLGIVSQNYSILGDLMPIIGGASDVMIAPFLTRFLGTMDDAAIPVMAHRVVDATIENEELVLAEGFLTFEMEDLKRLKRLLEINLPIKEDGVYKVITE